MTSTPDAKSANAPEHPKDVKGAQPEQLVERMMALIRSDDARFEIRNGEEVLLVYTDIDAASIALEALKAVDYSALATALSECREARAAERERDGMRYALETIRAVAKGSERVSSSWLLARVESGLAAQPPSEASERSG